MISPLKLVEVDNWIKVHVPTYLMKFKSPNKVYLKKSKIWKLALHLGEDQNKQRYVVYVQQFVEDLVYVLPGWVHHVHNRHACVKFDWVFNNLESLILIVQSNQMGQNIITNAPDYMVVTQILIVVVVAFA